MSTKFLGNTRPLPCTLVSQLCRDPAVHRRGTRFNKGFKMKTTKDIKFEFLGSEYEVFLTLEEYAMGGLAVQAFTTEGEPWSTVSVNLPDYTTAEDEIFADTSNGMELWSKLVQEGILTPTGEIGYSGFCSYPKCKVALDEFNVER